MYQLHSLIAGLLLLPLSLGHAADVHVTVAGSTTVFPVVEAAQKAYAATHPGVTFVVGQGDSGAGIEKAGKGEVLIGMSSRALKPAESQQYPDLVAVPIGTDGLAVVVNAANKVADLTSAQIANIFCGKITDWTELGSSGPIALASEQEQGGTLDAFKHHFSVEAKSDGEGALKAILFKAKGTDTWSTVRAKRCAGSKEILATVVGDPTAIGFVSVAAAERMIKKGGAVKMLPVDGSAASSERIASGAYTLTRPLLLLSKPTAPAAVQDFIAFMVSDAGQAIVAANEFLPVAK